ncbi:MAG TPA: hypothetical protein VKX49_31145 [Bryobacteraceae bacterium]|nr:hypothetical protein [Bryobacteraceae bacterium]
MRSNQDLSGSNNARVNGALGVPVMPLEWLDARSWRLPSGKALAEFALQAGFLAPLLFRPDIPAKTTRLGSAAGLRSKSLGKGESR